ncbi:MAG: ABC transporter ATP-binding protein [Lewinellaceae bacterium]|nr:ABC transporter ATP-binding protein [Phaeodactylibacter sp.]MCB9351609.1 ABC transporter ATP-binding protein [Lewinellaceae bacterium]
MIEARQLTRRYGSFTAVDGVSFQLGKGQALALIGPSGCGKTTTLKMVNRLIRPTEGSVWVGGMDVAGQPLEELRRRMGYVIQDTGLFPHYTVEENIGVVPKLLRWPAGKIRSRVGALLEQLGLPPGQFLDKYPHQLSGGQQQRIGIARALAAEPPIILMDEPFGALDPLTRQQARRDFREIEALKNKTIILVTHDIEEAFEMANLIGLMKDGRLQQLGPPRQLLLEPANDFVREFLAEKASQLELQSVTLAGVFPQLIREAPTLGPVLELPSNTPLLYAIHRLGKEGERYAHGVTQLAGERRYFHLDELFQAYKQTLSQWNN